MRATISRRSPTIASSSVIASVARSCGSGRSSARFQRLVLQPGDVELVRPLGNLGRVEATEAAGLAQVFALRLALAVRVGAVALLELGEVLRAERSVLLRDARDVAPRVEDPDILSRTAFLEEDHVRLHSLAVRSERAARQSQDRVQVAVLHQDLEDLARLALEQTVVRQHHRGSPARLQRVDDVLHEVELLVAGLDQSVA